jgi:hypothetical protein
MLSRVIAEEGLGVLYLFDYYWRRARKHVAVIFLFSELLGLCVVESWRREKLGLWELP